MSIIQDADKDTRIHDEYSKDPGYSFHFVLMQVDGKGVCLLLH